MLLGNNPRIWILCDILNLKQQCEMAIGHLTRHHTEKLFSTIILNKTPYQEIILNKTSYQTRLFGVPPKPRAALSAPPPQLNRVVSSAISQLLLGQF